MIDEKLQPEEADKFDYFYVPCFCEMKSARRGSKETKTNQQGLCRMATISDGNDAQMKVDDNKVLSPIAIPSL